jgi:hypothetical protein
MCNFYVKNLTSTYTCFTKTGDIKIVSKQVSHDWIDENSVSAVLTTLNKINSDDFGANITNINLYIPNADGSKNPTKLNESQRAFIFDKLLPRVVKDYQEIYIFSDTNADYNNLENTLQHSNEFKIEKFIKKNKLFQHNKEFSNTSINGSEQIIDHVISRRNNSSVEYGGHLGEKNYHPALMTTNEYGKDVNSELCNENPIQDSIQDNKKTKVERDWSKLNDIRHLSGITRQFRIEENSQPYMEFWLHNFMIKFEAKANSFSAKCRLCGWAIYKPTQNFYSNFRMNRGKRTFFRLFSRKIELYQKKKFYVNFFSNIKRIIPL